MALSSGIRFGPYEILAPIGAGGMGEVYKAKDTRLDRTVAVKVLPGHAAAQPEWRQRFEREARAVSSLNHPHICTLYDVGQQDGVDFLVMEYLEGETVAARLARGPLPADQLLRYAVEIAEALAQAHRQGVFHRDLKPGNIMLTKSGAKLLDFGLAKLRALEPSAGGFTALPTAAVALTEKGSILGTFQYMAPEQLEGREADARSDIFSFGATLYEMATGRKAFEGRSQASLISAIMTSEPPPMSSLQPLTPPALERVVKKCLAKDPEERWESARDLASELKWMAEAGSQVGSQVASRGEAQALAAAPAPNRQRLWMVATAVLAIVSLAALAALAVTNGWLRPRPVEVGAARLALVLPEGTAIAGTSASPQVALSPDGRKLAFIAGDATGKTFLWVRPLGSLSAQRLDKTENSFFPFWSPDGQFIAFFADGKLKKIAFSGGTPQTICDAPNGQGGAWNREGVIVFAPTAPGSPLYRVSAAGGAATPVTKLDTAGGEIAHSWAQFLPDGKHFLYLAKSSNREKDGIYVQELGSSERRLLLNSSVRAAYSPPGHLLFVRGGTLFAQGLDVSRFQLQGEPVSVAEEVGNIEAVGLAAFSVSENGVLVYRSAPGGRTSQLVWYDRQGTRLQAAGDPGQYRQIALSPDDKRVAVERIQGTNAMPDLWLLELGSGIFTRLTFEPSIWQSEPVWSPDSRRIVLTTSTPAATAAAVVARSSKTELREIVVASGATSVVYSDEQAKFPDDWSRDGRFVVYHNGGRAVSLLPMVGERKPQTILDTPFRKDEFHFSPDSRWMAYQSNESGRYEIYVASLPSFAEKRQVSSGGGVQPWWRNDGKELFYVTLDFKLMAVDIEAGSGFKTGVPKPLFQTHMVSGSVTLNNYAVTGDGKKFLINEAGSRVSEQVNLVLNWTADLRR